MSRKILAVGGGGELAQLQGLLGTAYAVVAAEENGEALSVLRGSHKSISAVLLDLTGPAQDGFELLRAIRANALWRAIPVAVITGASDEAAQIAALRLGANACVTKPYNEALKCLLHNAIQLCETAAIANAASKDKLTGLLNRETFFIEAERRIRRQEPGYYLLSCVDIESFKVINDQYGTETGDKVLRHVAACLEDAVSRWEGIACRFMADRFALLYPASLRDSEEIRLLQRHVAMPACLDRTIRIRVGRYLVDDAALPVSAMYDRAAMAEASIKGRYDLYIAEYHASLRQQLLDQQAIVGEMHGALRAGQFEPWFQPQYNHATGALVGAEALVRWRHPKRGLISPAVFIPIFERNGFIYAMDRYIWEQVCKLLRSWLDAGENPLPISVNISRYDALQDDFVQVITDLVDRYAIPTPLLRLEITESAFSEASDPLISKVKMLIDRGFTLELDDFGSGYSSLHTLKDVPAQILKLDMRFLDKADDSQRSGNIVESVVRMARWLGMSVIAEGVETGNQADFLNSIGCYYVQGFYYARPMPQEEYETLARRHVRQHRLDGMATAENYNNGAFWNADSLDTMVFNHFSGGAFILESIHGRYEMLRVNAAFAQAFHSPLTNDEILKIEPFSGLEPAARARVEAALSRARESGEAVSCELYSRQYAGSGEHIRLTLRHIAACGERSLFYGYVDNITALVLEQQKNARTSERLRLIMEHVSGGVAAAVVRAGSIRYLFANARFYTLIGRTKAAYEAEFCGTFSAIDPADSPRVQAAMLRAGEDLRPYDLEFRIRRGDGRMIWLSAHVAIVRLPEEDEPVHLAMLNDITARKETEDRLRFINDLAANILSQASNEEAVLDALRRILAYFDAERSYIVELDPERGMSRNSYEVCAPGISSQQAALQAIPYSDADFWYGELTHRRFFQLADVEALGETQAALRRLLTGQGIRSLLLAPLWRDGRLIGFAGLDNPKKPPREPEHLAALADFLAILLTRRDLEDGLRAANTAQLELLDNLPCGAALYNYHNGKLTARHLNRRYWELVQRSPAADSEENFLEAVYPDDRAIIPGELEAAIRQGRDFSADLRILCGQGAYKPFRVTATLRRQANGDYLAYAAYRPVVQTEAAFELQTLLHVIPSGILKYAADETQEFQYINRNFMEGLGYTERQFREKFHNCFREMVYAGDRARVQREIDLQESGGGIGRFDYRVEAADGSLHWVHDEGVMAVDEAGKAWYFVALNDITEQKQAVETLRQSEEAFQLAAHLSGTVICRYDVAERVITLPADTSRQFSLPERLEDVPYGRVRLGKISPDTAQAYIDFFERILHGEQEGAATFRKLLPGGWRWVTAHFAAVTDETGKPVSAVISFADVTEQMEMRERAETDPLTGILNRTAFAEELTAQLRARAEGSLQALFMLDLDGFKQVNDTYGHTAGDQTLTEVANRLRAQVRSSDLVCRLGGDEFMVFLGMVPDRASAARKAEQICRAFHRSFPAGVQISASIGIALSPGDGDSFEVLYSRADAALYQAKRAGRDRYAFADSLS